MLCRRRAWADEKKADGIQILRYQQRQAYIAHTDYFPKHQSSDCPPRGSHGLPACRGESVPW
jgi:hypothetical protein